MFGQVLFKSSRFLFWSLAPFLIGFVAVTAMLVPDWASPGGLLAATLDAAALLLLLQLHDPRRFHWAGRVLAGLVFLAYAAYLTSAGASTFDAFRGLLIIGVPAGLYAWRGRWTLRTRNEDAATAGDRGE